MTKSPKERLEQVVGATLLKIGLDLLEEHREDLVRIGGGALSKITRAVVTGKIPLPAFGFGPAPGDKRPASEPTEPPPAEPTST